MSPEQAQDQEQEQNQEQETSQQAEQQQVDWETDDNPYKKRYGDSQSQIMPLVQILHKFLEYNQTNKTWKPKSLPVQTLSQDTDFGKMLEGYDPEFVKALGGYTEAQIKKAINAYNEESISMQRYNSQMLEGRGKAIEEFGSEFDFSKDGKMNPASSLYQLANEILTNKYVELNQDGTFHKYTNPDAEYLATAEAYALLSKRAKQQQPDKGKLNAIQGKGSKASGIKKSLSFDEYRKLSQEDQDAYDLLQIGG